MWLRNGHAMSRSSFSSRTVVAPSTRSGILVARQRNIRVTGLLQGHPGSELRLPSQRNRICPAGSWPLGRCPSARLQLSAGR